jgi:hypothetical protein
MRQLRAFNSRALKCRPCLNWVKNRLAAHSPARQLLARADEVSNEHFATHHLMAAHVRFGSKAAATVLPVGVRFTPESGHEDVRSARPLWAKIGLMHCNKIGL